MGSGEIRRVLLAVSFGNYKKRLNGGISAHGWCSQIWRLENGSFEELSI